MKQVLYIHIGRPKVGSSAIQSFLNLNRQRLIEKGLLYPLTGLYQQASHKLSLVFLPDLPDYIVVENTTAKMLYRKLFDEIRQLNLPKVIISSENFWLIEPKQIASLLGDQFDVKVICYVRRQDDVALSSYIQEIKGGLLPVDYCMEEYLASENRKKYLDYSTMLHEWAQQFGRDNVIISVFETLEQRGGIERDLLSLVGVDGLEDFKYDNYRKNASPAYDILNFINRVHRFDRGDITNRFLIGVLTEISEVIGFDDRYDTRRLMSDADRQSFLSEFELSNQNILTTYRVHGAQEPGKMLFPEVEQQKGVPQLTDNIDLARLRDTMAGLVSYQQHQISLLRARLNEQERKIQTLENRHGVNDSGISQASSPSIDKNHKKDRFDYLKNLKAFFLRN